MLSGKPRVSTGKHHFFKVMVNNFQKRTRIPEAFIKQMPEELSGIAILHGPSGNGWPVMILKSTKGTYLEDGWEAFVTDHTLSEGEFLVFTYVPSMHFNVKIFGRNACEREDAFTVQASLKSPRGDEAKFTAKDTSHGPTSLKKRKKCQSPRRDAGKITSYSKLKALGANEAAHHFTNSLCDRPKFVSQIKHYFLHTHNYLAVPAFFVRKHLPKTKMMKLRSPIGREWTVKFYFGLPRCPSRLCCGWIQFASANHIKEGDSCVFELVQEDTLQVHIFRC